ncbi:hypothetical protein [Variovorax soli]|uniref:hypothetical protein n=1 Tax=Variovorax soli TaxID=376815 RepID=UPI0008391F6E|nr:hypothetical protein [Variovorax soli]
MTTDSPTQSSYETWRQAIQAEFTAQHEALCSALDDAQTLLHDSVESLRREVLLQHAAAVEGGDAEHAAKLAELVERLDQQIASMKAEPLRNGT